LRDSAVEVWPDFLKKRKESFSFLLGRLESDLLPSSRDSSVGLDPIKGHKLKGKGQRAFRALERKRKPSLAALAKAIRRAEARSLES
jgi:hypothetical protein